MTTLKLTILVPIAFPGPEATIVHETAASASEGQSRDFFSDLDSGTSWSWSLPVPAAMVCGIAVVRGGPLHRGFHFDVCMRARGAL